MINEITKAPHNTESLREWAGKKHFISLKYKYQSRGRSRELRVTGRHYYTTTWLQQGDWSQTWTMCAYRDNMQQTEYIQSSWKLKCRICQFVKWQIRPFSSKAMTYSAPCASRTHRAYCQIHWTNAGPMPGQRLRLWSNTRPALEERYLHQIRQSNRLENELMAHDTAKQNDPRAKTTVQTWLAGG